MHLSTHCQYNACLCAKNVAKDLHSKINSTKFVSLDFGSFMDKCGVETDHKINTQMIDSLGGMGRTEIVSERQCCGIYPDRKAFTYKSDSVGEACCQDKNLYFQKSQVCCAQGDVLPMGNLC
jgi:hypothetical protein